MKTSFYISVLYIGSVISWAAAPDAAKVLAKAPLRFEPAASDGASYIARGAKYRFSFTGTEATLRTTDQNVRLRFAGANPHARLDGAAPMRSTTAVYLGQDRSKWRSGIPNYARLQAHDLYRGIDLVYYGNGGELEYDLTVKPGADPRQIRLKIDGGNAHLDSDGNLVAGLIQKRPVAYQTSDDGTRIAVESRYKQRADGSFGFALGRYDRKRELVIDPVLTLSTYLAGSNQDIAAAIGHDAAGFLYIAGVTLSTDFVQSGTQFQSANGGNQDVFLAKVDPNAAPGTEIVYSTYLGGSANETVGAMVVGPNGDVYMVGTTASGNFPTANAFFSTQSGSTTLDAFVCHFDTFQTLVYSTYLGGSGDDTGNGIAVDANGIIWVTGSTNSDDFPNLLGFQTVHGGHDAFVTGLDPTQSGTASLRYSTYLGGSGPDVGRGIAVAPDGTLWVVGGTYSVEFPIAAFNFQANYGTAGDAFATHIDPTAGAAGLLYSTYLGGSGQEEAKNVVVLKNGNVVVTGFTISSDFPTTFDALQRNYGGDTDIFISVLNPKAAGPSSAQLVYSTYFGGANADGAYDMKVDSAGNLYLAGFTLSPGLPLSPGALQSAYGGTMDAFVLVLNPSKPGISGVVYFTYLGSDGLQIAYGVDFDSNGKIFLVGGTSGPLFDAFGGTAKSTAPGTTDGFVIGFNPTKQ